ncbi:hypothetical protein [Streptomyces olivaceus]|uniref:hypothetical protein n=1 Tax=Streptomyces olivaceus TaxID=47716 RepID=UPI0022EF1E21|nr:hypothetical protein [Streptomyces olivaceus]GHI98093.1 hypothetical protein TPA0905_75640 [Streptomyces olivaceus]
MIAEDIQDELCSSLGHDKPHQADYVQRVHEVAVHSAETLREILTRAAEIDAAHRTPGHGMECTCDLDALDLIQRLAAYATKV